MKKIIAMLLVLTMMLAMAACGGSGNSGNNSAAAEVKTITPGKLTVAISPDFAPMEFVDPTKEGQDMYVGFDVALSKYIAESMGLELVIMPMSFDACQTAVYSGTVDISVSGFSWTEERAENYNISNYYHAGDNEDEQCLITLASNGDKFATAESLVGVKVGAQNASLQQSLVEEQLPESELILFSDLPTAVLQLKAGDFDCIAVAKGNGEGHIAQNPELAFSGYNFVVDEKYTGNVILIQKGNDAMTEAVNAALDSSKDLWDGWYAEAKATAGIDQSYDDEGNAVS